MKILHVIPSISERSGGPAQAIFPMCRALQNRGLALSIATTNHDMSPQTLDSETVAENCRSYKGVSTYLFPIGVNSSFKYSAPFASWLNSKVTAFDVIHIHAVFNHACLAAARACQRRGIPYIVRPLGTLDPWSMKQKPLRKKLFWWLAGKRMLSRASAVHYTAQAELEATEESLRLTRGRVIPLGIDIDELSPEHIPLGKVTGDFAGYPYVLVLSRLHSKKGLDILIDAFVRVVNKPGFSDWRLLLVGDGDERYVQKLKQMVADKNAQHFVSFPGWVNGAEKALVLQRASLLALTSYQENFGLCVLEALAHGVPVLVSPQVNLARDIEAATAGWVSAVTVDALEERLTQALADESERRRRGEAGRDLVERFSWPKIAEELEDLYLAIASPRKHKVGLDS